jgi:hypothetical protein
MYFVIFRGIALKKYHHGGVKILSPAAWEASIFATELQMHLFLSDKMSKTLSADNLSDKSRNLSSFITECGIWEKFELLLEKYQLIERRKFFRNICCSMYLHEIARKYPREKKYSSNFFGSVVHFKRRDKSVVAALEFFVLYNSGI